MNRPNLNILPGLDTALKLYDQHLKVFEKNYSKAAKEVKYILNCLDENNSAAEIINAISNKEIKIYFHTTYDHSTKIIDSDIADLTIDEVETIKAITKLEITNRNKENKNILESWLIKANNLLSEIQDRHSIEADNNLKLLNYTKEQMEIISSEIRNILYGELEANESETSLLFDRSLTLKEDIDLIIKEYKSTNNKSNGTLSKTILCKITRQVYENKYSDTLSLRNFTKKVYPIFDRELKINRKWTVQNFENMLSKTI